MKRLLVSIFLIISFSLQAGDLSMDKKTLIERSFHEYQEAISELNKAQSMCWYIPDIHKRENINTLIGSAISAANTKNPRAAVLVMILPLLANALSNMQEKYMEMMHCFKLAEHHFEMAKTYNDLSLQRHLHTSTDQGTIIFFEGIDYLTAAIVLAQTIHPSYGQKGQEDRVRVVNSLNWERKKFLNDQAHIGYKAQCLYENMDEITIGLDNNYRREIADYVYLAAMKFAEAEKVWYYAKQQKKREKKA